MVENLRFIGVDMGTKTCSLISSTGSGVYHELNWFEDRPL
jgi:hypothetical protein